MRPGIRNYSASGYKGTAIKQTKVTKPKRGRPETRIMPPPILATPENVAGACVQGPPKKNWNFLKPKPKA